MAEVVAISLQVDGGNSYKQIKKLESGISDLIDETNELNETNIQFKKELQELTNTYNELPKSQLAARSQVKKQMEELKFAIKDNNIALQEFRIKKQQKQKMVNDLKGVQKEAKKTAQELGNIAEGVGHGYKAFLGVTTALGGSNDKLIEAYVKLESVTKGLEGFEKLRKMGLKDSAFLTSALSVKTKVLIGLQKAYTLVLRTGIKASKGLKAALLATGVGAIIAALGTIVAYWDDIKGAVSGLSSEQKKRNADLEKEKELTQANLDNISATENTLRLAGKSEQEILDMKLAQLDIQLDQQRQTIENAKLQKKTQVEASERNNKIAQNTIRILSLPITMLLGAIDLLTYGLAQVGILEEATNLEESFSGGIASMLFNPEDVASESDKTIEEAEKGLAELQNTRDGYTLKEQEKRKTSSDKAIADKKKQFEKELQMLRDKMQKELDMEEEMQDLIIENMEDEDAKTLAKLKLQHDRELAALRDKYGMETELEIELLKKQARQLDEAKKKIAQESKDEMDEMANFFEQEEDARRDNQVAKNIQATQTELTNLEQTEKAKQQVRLASVNAAAGILNGLASLFEENEKVQKANALAQIAIDTALGFVNGLNIAQKSAKATGPAAAVAFPLFYASQVGAVLSAAGQAKKILSSGGNSGVTPPSISTPSIPTTVTSGTAPTGNNTGNGRTEIPTTKVVLVESELQAMQSRRMQVDTIATI